MIQPYVVLVTASRFAKGPTHKAIIRQSLRVVAAGLPVATQILLRHGAARGGDTLAEQIARDELGWLVDPIPADWDTCQPDCNPRHRKRNGTSTYCPRAGVVRNEAMVDKQPYPDAVLGFPLTTSDPARSGTWHCVHYAASRGLRVQVCPLMPVGSLPHDEPHGKMDP